MYCNFFGLRCLPFEDRADTQFYYATSDREETLAAMEYEARYGKEMALVLGEAGTGKTLLVRALLSHLHASDHVVVLTWSAAGQMSLIREACKGLGLTLPSNYSRSRGLARLRKHLKRSAKAERRSILVIDQAENLSVDNMSQLMAILDLQHEDDKIFTIILVGQPQFRTLLDKPQFARIRQQLFGERTLDPLSLADTVKYIHHRLQIAGAGDADLFDHDAVTVIHRASRGIPRLINFMCNAALLAAYGADAKGVNEDMALDVTQKQIRASRTAKQSELGASTALEDVDRAAAGATSKPSEVTVAAAPPTDASWTTAEYDEAPQQRDARRESILSVGDGTTGESFPGRLEVPVEAGMESLLARGEGLLERLESVLARADRMSATSEATLTQSTAVEKHLGVLTQNAQRATESLSGSLHSATQSFEGIDDRMDRIFADAEHRVGDIEAQIARVPEASHEAAQSAAKVTGACERAAQVESTLKTFAEQLADQAQVVQERISVLMAGLETKEEAQRGLSTVLERVATATSNADTRTAALGSQLKDQIEELASATSLAQAAQIALRKEARQTIAETKQTRERISADALEQFDRKAQDRLSELLDRMSKATADADTRVATLESKLEGQLEQVSSVIAQAEAARERITDDAVEQFDRKAQDRLSELLDRVSKATTDADTRVSTLGSKLDGQLEQVSSVIAQAEATRDTLRAESRQAIATARQSQEKLTNEMLERCRRGLKQQFDRLDSSSGEIIESVEHELSALGDRISTVMTEGSAKLDLAVAGRREKLDTALAEFETRAQHMNEMLEASCERAQEAVATAEREQAAFTEKVWHEATEAQSRAEAIESQVANAQRSFAALSEEIAEAHSTTGTLSQRVDEFQSSVSQHAQRAERASATLTKAVERGDKLMLQIHSDCGQIEAVQRSVTAHLVDIGTAQERVSTARQQIADCEQVAERLATGHEDGTKLLDQIQRVAAEASGVSNAIRSAAGGAETTVAQLDSHAAAAKHVLHELSDANVQGHTVVERVVATIRVAEESAASVTEQADRITSDVAGLTEKVVIDTQELAERQRAAEALIERVDCSTQPVEQLVEQLIARTSEAGRQETLIADRCEQAGQFVERLSSMDRILRETIQAETSTRSMVEQARSIQEELTQLTEGAEQTLQERRTTAEALIERVNASTRPAQDIHEKLSQKTARAEEQLAGMAERCEQAGEVDVRLASLSKALEAVEGAQASALSTAQDAQALHKELAATTSGATDQAAILRDLVTTSTQMVDRHTELQQVSEQTVRELGEKMEANQNSGVAADRLLQEFNAQARTLERGIRTLQARAEEIEQSISKATARPAELVTIAQAQAAQLERVCSAVRKVFGGLSKATLEARKQTETLARASGEATDRFANLQSETQRASTTLHEWVEEAVRVQSRLQRTLQQAPSINETHPVDTLSSMSRVVDSTRRTVAPASRIANAGTGGELTMLSQPPAANPEREGLAVVQDVRTDQVSRLIEDAKRTAAH